MAEAQNLRIDKTTKRGLKSQCDYRGTSYSVVRNYGEWSNKMFRRETKNQSIETNASEKNNEAKADYFSTMVGEQANKPLTQTLENTFKGNDKSKTSGRSVQALANSFWTIIRSNQIRKSNRYKQKEGPEIFWILGKCCSCNNWRLPGEPQISDLTPPQ